MVLNSLLIGLLVLDGEVEWLERTAFDTLFAIRGTREPRAPIVIIALDQGSFDHLSQAWPLSRAIQAQLIEKLSSAAPLVIGVDLIFSGPSVRGPEDDHALTVALSRARNVVLASSMAHAFGDPPARVKSVRPLAEFESAALAVGPATLVVDPDGIVRRGAVWHNFNGGTILSFATQIAQRAASASVGAPPSNQAPIVLINFRGGPRTYPQIPYDRVIRNEVPDGMIRGKIVLVGSVDRLDHDFYSTPFATNQSMPGVEVQANLVETVLRSNHIREVPLLISLIVAMSAAALTTSTAVLPFGRAVLASALGFIVICTVALIAFVLGDIWFRSVSSLTAFLLGFGSAMVLKARSTSSK
jgi:CHASE2 domain-containing sensor protein